MKNLQFNPYQCKAGMGRFGSKKSKPISAPPHAVRLKSPLIPAPLPLQGRKNPCGMKWGGAGQAR